MTGSDRRLAQLFNPSSGHTLIVPVDDSLIAGPTRGLEDLNAKVREIAAGAPDAVLGFSGQFERHADLLADARWIFNLTASTTRGAHTRKQQIMPVAHAVRLGADAVAAHVNLSSRYEPEMLATLGRVIGEARDLGVPVVAIMYPRTEASDGSDDNYTHLRESAPQEYGELVAHAVRVATDLGASAVKTQYTGSVETFRKVARAAGSVPVVIAGGPLRPPLAALEMAEGAVQAGARGISFGRNVFSRDPSTPMIKALTAVVHEGVAALDAAKKYQLLESE